MELEIKNNIIVDRRYPITDEIKPFFLKKKKGNLNGKKEAS